jgi:hypothetical protein
MLDWVRRQIRRKTPRGGMVDTEPTSVSELPAEFGYCSGRRNVQRLLDRLDDAEVPVEP